MLFYKDACCTLNKQVYDKIVSGMAEAGYERTGAECRDKLKNLKRDYKKLKTTTVKQADEGTGRHGNSTAA